MRLAAAFCFVFVSLVGLHSHAAQIFSCDGAEVRLEVVARDSRAWEDRVESVVTVSRDGANTVLRYRNIDFIGGQCFIRGGAQPFVIFQAFCGGSACKDLGNWGVIDPRSLRVLAVPSDSNREETHKLLGSSEFPRLEMMSVFAEALRQGIEVPE